MKKEEYNEKHYSYNNKKEYFEKKIFLNHFHKNIFSRKKRALGRLNTMGARCYHREHPLRFLLHEVKWNLTQVTTNGCWFSHESRSMMEWFAQQSAVSCICAQAHVVHAVSLQGLFETTLGRALGGLCFFFKRLFSA